MKQLNWYQIFGNTKKIPDGKTVLPTDDIQIWLNCADIWDKSYTTLAEVLADTDTLLALITSNNAVDYMVRSTTWAVTSSVPVMTSNTTPSGLCFAGGSQHLNSTDLYKIYDSNDSTYCDNTAWSDSKGACWIGYEFAEECAVDEAVIYISGTASSVQIEPTSRFKLQSSADGITYNDISGWFNSSDYCGAKHTLSCNSPKKGKYYRIYWNVQPHHHTSLNKWDIDSVYTVNFIANGVPANATAMTYIGQNNYASNTLLADATWCNAICNSEYFESVLNVKVPVMTSNTTPSGECISSGANQASEANYKAFDGDSNTLFSSSGSGTGAGLYLGYIFDAPTKVYLVKAVHRANTTSAVTMNFKYQSKTSDGDWRDISETFNVSINNNTPTTMTAVSSGSDDVSYRIYRNSSSIATRLGMWTLQFYGREDV